MKTQSCTPALPAVPGRSPEYPVSTLADATSTAADTLHASSEPRSVKHAATTLPRPASTWSRLRKATTLGLLAVGGGLAGTPGLASDRRIAAATGRWALGETTPWPVAGAAVLPTTYEANPELHEVGLAGRALLGDGSEPYVNPLCVGLPNIIDGMWLLKRHGVLEFCNVNTLRAQSVVHVLDIVSRDYPDLAEFDPVLVCSRDVIDECRNAMPNKTIPGRVALSFGVDGRQSAHAHGQSVLLVPDCVFWGWKEVGIDDYEQTVARMRAASRQPAERDVAGWVGNPKTNPFRSTMVNMTAQHPEDLEAVSMDWRPSVDGGQHLSWTEGGMKLPEQVKRWKYLVDVPGNGYSFRVKMFFHTLRPVIWQEQPWQEWYYPMLQAWEHYVPFAADGHDLIDKIRWLKDNPEKGQAIAHNAAHFARRHLSRASAIHKWADVLREVAHLQKSTPVIADTTAADQ